MKWDCTACRQPLPWEWDEQPDRKLCPKCERSMAYNNSLTVDQLAERKKKRRDEQDRARRKALVEKYGLTMERYEQMIVEQDGLCAICFEPPKRILVIDHDHQSGAVRGLLCANCNSAIGLMLDDAERLRSAADYVEERASAGTEPPVPPRTNMGMVTF